MIDSLAPMLRGELEVHQWWANGDHPADRVGELLSDTATGLPYRREEGAVVRFFRHPQIPGAAPCAHCDYLMSDHGWIDAPDGGNTVCPGDFVLTGPETGEYYPCKPSVMDLLMRCLRKARDQ